MSLFRARASPDPIMPPSLIEREVEIAAYKADVRREARAFRAEVAVLRRTIMRGPVDHMAAMQDLTGRLP